MPGMVGEARRRMSGPGKCRPPNCCRGCNLDRKNPHAKADIEHLPPEQLVESIMAKERRIAEIITNITALLGADRT